MEKLRKFKKKFSEDRMSKRTNSALIIFEKPNFVLIEILRLRVKFKR